MESHWHWMPEDFFFFFNHTYQAGGFGNLQTRYNEVEMQTWKYPLLHNSKGLLIAARHSTRRTAAVCSRVYNNAEKFWHLWIVGIKEAAVEMCVFCWRFRVCWCSNTLHPGRWASSGGSQVARQRAEWPLCFVISQVTHIITLERAGGRALGDAGGIQNAWFSA